MREQALILAEQTLYVCGRSACYPGRERFEAHSHLALSQFEFDVIAHEIPNSLYQVGVPGAEVDEFMRVAENHRDKVIAPTR